MNDRVKTQEAAGVATGVRPRSALSNVVAITGGRAGAFGAPLQLDIDPTDAEMMREWLLEIKDLTVRIETVLDASQRGRK